MSDDGRHGGKIARTDIGSKKAALPWVSVRPPERAVIALYKKGLGPAESSGVRVFCYLDMFRPFPFVFADKVSCWVIWEGICQDLIIEITIPCCHRSWRKNAFLYLKMCCVSIAASV